MIGLFDSGIGGLSVWREVAAQLPARSTLYVGDQAHLPYGPKPAETLMRYARGVVRFLREEGCRAVVVACNSASAAALKPLREENPDLLFVGMEPAVKPAAERTRSRVVVVLATPATLKGELFAATRERYARGVRVIGEPCPGLVERIESGQARSRETEALLREFLAAGMAAGADEVVLACTHYPFVIETIRGIVGPSVEVIDPAPAVARQLRRLLEERGLAGQLGDGPPEHHFCTTAPDPQSFTRTLTQLTGLETSAVPLEWVDDTRLTRRAG